MIIKKYVGKTESEATQEAKKELGGNIVVMNVRPMKKTGLFSFFQSQKIEVTVALEEETERQPKVYVPKKEPLELARPPLTTGGQKDVVTPSPSYKSKDIIDDSTAIEEKLDNLSSLLEKNIKFSEKEEPTYSDSKADLKSEKETSSKGSLDVSEDTMSFIKLLYNTLIENEVDEIYVNQLTDEVEKIIMAKTKAYISICNSQ